MDSLWNGGVRSPADPLLSGTTVTIYIYYKIIDIYMCVCVILCKLPSQHIANEGMFIQENLRTSLVAQWLRLCTPNAGGLSSIPDQETRYHIPQLRPDTVK